MPSTTKNTHLHWLGNTIVPPPAKKKQQHNLLRMVDDMDFLCFFCAFFRGPFSRGRNWPWSSGWPWFYPRCPALFDGLFRKRQIGKSYHAVTINHVVCHGIPDENPLEEGYIINIDVSLKLDHAYFVCFSGLNFREHIAWKRVQYITIEGPEMAIDLISEETGWLPRAPNKHLD